MAAKRDEILDYLKRIDQKLDRLLESFALPKELLAPTKEITPKEPDQVSELLDAFEKLSREEQRRDIERANEFLRVHGSEGLDRLEDLLPSKEELK